MKTIKKLSVQLVQHDKPYIMDFLAKKIYTLCMGTKGIAFGLNLTCIAKHQRNIFNLK
jgi:hypothetical protein